MRINRIAILGLFLLVVGLLDCSVLAQQLPNKSISVDALGMDARGGNVVLWLEYNAEAPAEKAWWVSAGGNDKLPVSEFVPKHKRPIRLWHPYDKLTADQKLVVQGFCSRGLQLFEDDPSNKQGYSAGPSVCGR